MTTTSVVLIPKAGLRRHSSPRGAKCRPPRRGRTTSVISRTTSVTSCGSWEHEMTLVAPRGADDDDECRLDPQSGVEATLVAPRREVSPAAPGPDDECHLTDDECHLMRLMGA